jgi:hypothetical protein
MPQAIFNDHDRYSGDYKGNKVRHEECTASVLMGHITEAPDIA